MESQSYPPIPEALLVEEFKACRERISKEIDIINQIEIGSFIAIGAMLFFILEKANTIAYHFGGMLLICFIFWYGRIRYNAHRLNIRIHEMYIEQNIEPLIKSLAPGMMKHYNDNKTKYEEILNNDKGEGGYLKKARIAFWWSIFGVGNMILFSAMIYKLIERCK